MEESNLQKGAHLSYAPSLLCKHLADLYFRKTNRTKKCMEMNKISHVQLIKGQAQGPIPLAKRGKKESKTRMGNIVIHQIYPNIEAIKGSGLPVSNESYDRLEYITIEPIAIPSTKKLMDRIMTSMRNAIFNLVRILNRVWTIQYQTILSLQNIKRINTVITNIVKEIALGTSLGFGTPRRL